MSAHQILASLHKANLRTAALPEFRAGDSVKVWAKIREGEKTRLQAFEGVCIRRVSNGHRSTFTIRKISYGVGVERIFPDHSPNIDKIEVVSRGQVHQSRLFYLRDLSGKAARIKERDNVIDPNAEALPVVTDEMKEKIKGRGKRKKLKEATAG
jgi:large subunit ribosomal protein L19